MTPFHFCNNNPIIYIDPTGMSAYIGGGADIYIEDGAKDGDKPRWVEKYDEKQGKIVGQWVYDTPSGSSSGSNSGGSGGSSNSGGSGSSGGSGGNNNTATAGSGATTNITGEISFSNMDGTSIGGKSDGACNNPCSGYTESQIIDGTKNAINNGINKISNPGIDLAIGATEYKVGVLIAQGKSWSFTKAPWEAKPINKITTIIRTPVGNVHTPTSTLVKIGKVFKGVGVATGLVGLAGSAIQYGTAKTSQEKNEAIVDGVIGLVGFVPGGGWIVSGAYFLIVKPMFKAGSSINLIQKPSIGPVQDNTRVVPRFNIRR